MTEQLVDLLLDRLNPKESRWESSETTCFSREIISSHQADLLYDCRIAALEG